MAAASFPRNYQEWQYCITVECGLELTPDYISQRITALQNASDHYTRRFVELYGSEYLEQVIKWFVQAQKDVGGAPS